MYKVQNECVGCTSIGLQCIGSSCPNRNVTRYYCDRCGEECDGGNSAYGFDDLCDICHDDLVEEYG